MDVCAAFVADAQAAVLVQPADRALDDPALFAETGAVRLFRPWDGGADPAGTQFLPVAAGVVGAVAEQPLRPAARPAALATHRRDRIHERQQLEDVVLVAAGEGERERCAPSAGQRMVLGAAPGAVYRAWTGLLAPPTARMCELSITARDQSIRSAWCNFASNNSCNRCQTPACCHSCSRRQQVIPEPQPISSGRYSHGVPVRNTNRIPVSTFRS